MTDPRPLGSATAPERLIGGATDVGGRFAGEDTLGASGVREASFRLATLATDAVQGFVYDWDPATDRVQRFGGPDDFLGCPPDEVPSDVAWFADRIHPDDLPQAIQAAHAAFESGAHGYALEYRIRHRDGHWIEVVDRARIIRDDTGHTIRVVGGTSDVSARRRLEREREQLLAALAVERARLAEVFRVAPSFFAVFRGPEYVYEFVNDAYYGVVGRRDLLGRSVWEVFPEAREQGSVEILDRVLHEGTPFIGREVRIEVHPPDGGPPDERFVDLTYVPRTEPDGTRSGVIAHGVDVTAHVHARRDVERLLGEYKQLAQREREAREAAEANARARDDVLAVVTHDLGSPLAAISTAAASLSDPTAPLTGAKASTVIAVIERAAGSMHRMIRDLLDVASIEAGRLALERRPERADHLVTRAVELAAATARDRSIALETRIAPDLPRVHADAERVMQALGNLVTNALKFTPPGGRVTLVVADDPQSDSRGDATGNPAAVRFTVADTGRGIPANELPNVFDPFWQRRGGASRRGTGLGLAIVRGIVEAHGGQLRAESTLGTGSAFSFTIPTVP